MDAYTPRSTNPTNLMVQPPPLPSDGQLVDGARDGMAGAWNELIRRHEGAVTGVAKVGRRFGSNKAVARAIDTLRVDIGSGEPGTADVTTTSASVDEPSNDDGIRSVRARLLANLTGGSFGPGGTVDASVDGVELPGTKDQTIDLVDLTSVARAFATLPEPWQTALWHRVVERQTAIEYAPLLGRAANEATSAVQRADAGLFEAYLIDQRAQSEVAPGCVPIIPLLGGSLRSTLSAHEQRLVDDHLGGGPSADGRSRGCDACARRVAVSRALSTLLPAAVVPELAKMSVERYRDASGVRPATALVDPDDRRRRIAFGAIFGVLLLAAGTAVFFARDSLDVLDTERPTASTQQSTSTTEVGPTTSAPVGTPGPTTTELQLRPSATGPVNAVDVVFDEPGPVGFAPVVAEVSVVLSSPGPIFAGGTGTIDLTITNAGAADVVTGATLQVPDGVVFDAMVDGPASCVDPDDDSARCEVSVAAGATERVTIRFRLQGKNVGQFVVNSNLAVDELRLPITAVNRLVHSSVDEGQVIVAGNTLMTCIESDPDCVNARNGVGEVLNRWDLPLEFVGADRGPDWFNSSSATIDLGAGTVDAAYLFWSGDLNERNVTITDDGRSGRVSLLPPGADEPVEVEAERIRRGDVDATQYFGSVDVTEIVKAYGDGQYTVGNVQSVEVQGSYAGWVLVVVTRDDTLPRRSHMVVSPFSWFSPDDTFAIEIDVPLGGEHQATFDVVAFEGERGFIPEYLTVGGEQLGDSSFDSTITGERDPSYDNNFGIDVDAYDLVIDASNGILPIVATSDNDGIRLAVLALSVDVG
jgi:hypothetical protein